MCHGAEDCEVERGSHTTVPAVLKRGFCVPLFGGKCPTRHVQAAPLGFSNPFKTLLHSASSINWIICFLTFLLRKSN